eukprot:SAG31_NODE_733_length_12491_cov_7.073112_5_plen_78_part_00
MQAFAHEFFDEYQLLNEACLALPVGELIHAVARCEADPCKAVHCGDNGSCIDGKCQCELGYEGGALLIRYPQPAAKC